MVKTKIEKAAFIGLGVMGYPMAGHLAKSGFSVMVYNRTKSKADRWVSEFGGRAAATPREALILFFSVSGTITMSAQLSMARMGRWPA